MSCASSPLSWKIDNCFIQYAKALQQIIIKIQLMKLANHQLLNSKCARAFIGVIKNVPINQPKPSKKDVITFKFFCHKQFEFICNGYLHMCYLYNAKIGNINMITSIFNKTRPINYIILFALLLLFYITYQTNNFIITASLVDWVVKSVSFLLLLSSLFLMHFIYNRNNLVRDNMYGALFSFLFCFLFPQIFDDSKIVCSLFLLVLAFRRLISLRSKLGIKQKLFDSCVLILIASLFYFWSILFLIVVFYVILFQTSFNFKNWLIPFIAIFIIGSIVIMAEMILNSGFVFTMIDSLHLSFNLSIIRENKLEFFIVCFYATIVILFLFSSFITSGSRSVNQHSVYNIFYLVLLISIFIFFFNPVPNYALVSYSFFPLAILGSNMIENIERKWIKETFLVSLTVLILLLFFIQL